MKSTSSFLTIIGLLTAIVFFVLINWDKNPEPNQQQVVPVNDTTKKVFTPFPVNQYPANFENEKYKTKKHVSPVQEELMEVFANLDSFYQKNYQGQASVQTDSGIVMREWVQKINKINDSVWEEISIVPQYFPDSLMVKGFNIIYEFTDERGNLIKKEFRDIVLKNCRDTISYITNYAETAEYPDSLARPLENQKKQLFLVTRDVISILRRI